MTLTKTPICDFGKKAENFGLKSTENKEIPDNSLVVGSPGRVIRKVTDEEVEAIKENAIRYQENWKKYYKSKIS